MEKKFENHIYNKQLISNIHEELITKWKKKKKKSIGEIIQLKMGLRPE